MKFKSAHLDKALPEAIAIYTTRTTFHNFLQKKIKKKDKSNVKSVSSVSSSSSSSSSYSQSDASEDKSYKRKRKTEKIETDFKNDTVIINKKESKTNKTDIDKKDVFKEQSSCSDSS